jgi:glutamate-ammonia-ligase adenylyltransferase
MDEAAEILELLRAKMPEAPLPGAQARKQLGMLAAFCPVYRDLLRRLPELTLWLEAPETDAPLLHPRDFARLRQHPALAVPEGASNQERRQKLRRLRRAVAMRIAYRDLCGFADIRTSMRELTALAEFVLGEALTLAEERVFAAMGEPWDEQENRPARFAVLALGKMGGGELNFVSDLDLIYVSDGRGSCRKGTRVTTTPNETAFARLAREYTGLLQERTEEGFLFNIDLRLRPEGNSGPLVSTAAAMENYYYSSGQTWERMALMKARAVAGDLSLGGELLETLSPFRFPRTPPPSLFEEVAGLKIRIEHEVLGEENFRLDIKNGWGGIREIEFIVQALQCVYQGKNPFLQTGSTLAAMAGLERYEILTVEEVNFLCLSYLWLRRVEQRLQMRGEEHTQTLPPEGSPERRALALSLEMDEAEFEARLEEVRGGVRAMYERYFPISSRESLIGEWIEFIAGETPGRGIEAMIAKVFWGPRPPIEAGLRRLALGDAPIRVITRETALLMIDLSGTFPEALAPSAHPLRTLGRVNEYADRYGARKSFLRLCAGNLPFFKALCKLFDRSSFIHALVCAHPEILEELMMTGTLRLNKMGRVMRREIRALETDADEETAKALWLWIKAEQVRIAMAQVLSMVNLERVEFALSRLASVVVDEMLRRVDPEGEMAVVAMGKFGAREMSFGSDLDMMLVCRGESTETMTRKALRLSHILGFKGPLGAGFEVDMRLRPHGIDGPLVVSLPALDRYHHGHGGMFWERQALLRSRPISDRSDARSAREATAAEFMALREKLLFEEGPFPEMLTEVRSMRRRIEEEKTRGKEPCRCFKAGPGGILDCEFIAQTLQMEFGRDRPQLHGQNTRVTLAALGKLGILPEADAAKLVENYDRLRNIEFRLRREHNSPVTEIAVDSDLEHSIARWMNFPSFAALMDDLKVRMRENRALFDRVTTGNTGGHDLSMQNSSGTV